MGEHNHDAIKRKRVKKPIRLGKILLAFACIAVVASIFFLNFNNSHKEALIVQTNAFFAPFEFYDGDSIKGVDVDIMNKVADKVGKNAKFVNVEFSAIIDNVASGNVCDAGAAGITITPERAAKVDFSIPYYTSAQYVIFPKERAPANNSKYIIWESLAGKTIGVQGDTTGWIYADDEIANGSLKNTNTILKNFDSAQLAADGINSNFVDVVIIDDVAAELIASKNQALDILPLYFSDPAGDAPVEEEYAIAVAKGNTELLDAINKTLMEMMSNVDENNINDIQNLVLKYMDIDPVYSSGNFFAKIDELFSTPEYTSALWNGFLTTIQISIAASLLGLVLGTIVTLVGISKKNFLTTIPKFICNIYVTVIRGTPMALQLIIMFYVIFTFRGFPEIITAILAFGINSGAYVSENIRAGILSVDKGQTEAGLALGLPHRTVLRRVVFPQAIKNVIPAIGNELIALIKETSIVNMVGMYDLTMAAKVIGSGNNMASYLVPMTVAALFYLAIVYLLTFVVKLIEKRLRASDLH